MNIDLVRRFFTLSMLHLPLKVFTPPWLLSRREQKLLFWINFCRGVNTFKPKCISPPRHEYIASYQKIITFPYSLRSSRKASNVKIVIFISIFMI